MSRSTQALRIYQGLLWLYPSEFRDHFSREICLAFEDRMRERPGTAAVLAMYLSVLCDAPKEHYYMIRQDVVYALRTMRRERLSAFAAALVLALGIGSTVTVFTLIDGMLLRPLPYPEQERLVYIEEATPGGQGLRAAVAFPNYLDMRARNRSLEDFAMFGSRLATLRGDMEAERVPAAFVSEPAFRVLGVRPEMGRTFTVEEDRPKGPNAVLLSDELWRRRYGGDRAILGKTIIVGSDPTRVVGIMPPGFHFPDAAELWLPLALDTKTSKRTDHTYEGIARLRPGTSAEQAQSDLRAVMRRILEENPAESYNQTVNVFPYRLRDTRQVRPLLLTLLGAVGFVLLIACANIANLMLVKAAARRREAGIRAALGASRARLLRQFVAETMILAVLGAAAGIALARAAVPALLSLVPEVLPRWVEFSFDGRMLAFAILVTTATGVLAGLLPAISASRLDLIDVLKEGGRAATAGAGRTRIRNILVVAEVALSVVLLIGAGLMIRTLLNLSGQNAGFRPEDVTTFQTSAPASRYATDEKAAGLVRQVLREFRAIPGVVSAAGASGVPILDAWGRSITVENRPLLSLRDAPLINHTVVTTGYFQTLGIPILEGRDFTAEDGKNPLVTIIDSGLAKQYWPHESPIGKRVRYGPPESNEPWHVIVGVAGEARNQNLRELRRNSVYLPYGEFQFASVAYLVRTRPGTPDPVPALRARIAAIDRAVAISRVVRLEDAVQRSIWQERFFATLLAGFGALALLLAVVGLYGVLAYTVSQRTHEMGIRMALGASARDVQLMVVAQSGKLVGAGLVLGAGGAAVLTRLLQSELYEIRPSDPATIACVAAVLAIPAMAASFLLARRATRVDPMTALREE